MIHIKTPKEIELMREPCKIVRDTLEFIRTRIKAGMTTLEVDKLAYDYILSCGAEPSCLGYEGYPNSICISINEQVVHGIPNEDVIIKDGDIVSVDIVVNKNGYHGDATRTFLIGDVDEEKKRLVKVTEECFFKGIENVRQGTPLYDIGAKIQQHAESNGYSVVRVLVGHGIGREMHEDPNVPNYGKMGTGIRLKAGMTLAIEPMINMGVKDVEVDKDGWTVVTKDRKPSAHYENTVLITEDGVEVLTL